MSLLKRHVRRLLKRTSNGLVKSKIFTIKLLPFVLFLPIALRPALGSGQAAPDSVWMVAAYNVENLFDPRVDEKNPDTDFTPAGRYHWTSTRMRNKVHRIAQGLYTLIEGYPIAVLGLSEIENAYVVTQLAQHSILRRHRLVPIHRDSPDPRGIDVALLYNESFAALIDTQWLHPDTSQYRTRETLHATFATGGEDTLHVFQCHWPSRRSMENVQKREAVASILIRILDSIKQLPGHEYIVMGDFNEGYPSKLFDTFVSPMDSFRSENRHTVALKLNATQAKEEIRSYKFGGEWGSIDHIFVSNGLLRNVRGLASDTAYRIGCHPSLLESDPHAYGLRPKRMMLGPRYRREGTSDHLPVGFLLLQRHPRAEDEIAPHKERRAFRHAALALN